MKVEIPKVIKTEIDHLALATEVSFNSLIDHAQKHGLINSLHPTGLVYLPDQHVTQQFKDACKAVIDCLQKAEQV